MSKESMKLALEALLPKAIWNESIEGVFDVPLNEAAHAVVAIRKALTDLPEPLQHTYASKQATKCAGCGEHKHTPLRIDAMGGYVCLTCIDRKLGSLLGEFGYPKPEQPAQHQCKFPLCHSKEYQQAIAEQIKRELYTGEPAQQEPVAWLRKSDLVELRACNYMRLGADSPSIWAPNAPDEPSPDMELVALYASPPAQRKPLTDEQLMAIGKELGLKCRFGGNPNIDFDYARAIEAAHGIKENT